MDVVPVLAFHWDRDRRGSHENGRLKGTALGFEPESLGGVRSNPKGKGGTAASSNHMEKTIEQIDKKQDEVPSVEQGAQRSASTWSRGRRFGPSGRHRDQQKTRPHRTVDFESSRSYPHSRRRSTRSGDAKTQVDGEKTMPRQRQHAHKQTLRLHCEISTSRGRREGLTWYGRRDLQSKGTTNDRVPMKRLRCQLKHCAK